MPPEATFATAELRVVNFDLLHKALYGKWGRCYFHGYSWTKHLDVLNQLVYRVSVEWRRYDGDPAGVKLVDMSLEHRIALKDMRLSPAYGKPLT